MNRETDERLRLYNEGFCDSEIADKLGVSQKTISTWRYKRSLPVVFKDRKRLTDWEKKKIQDYLMTQHKYRNISTTLKRLEKGLTAFVMSLDHALSQVSDLDVENYVLKFNKVDLARKEELLRTDMVKQFKIPNLSMRILYGFASFIIASRIFYRDKGCTVCRSINPLHLHHIKGKYNLLEVNLTTLCENCHLSIRHASQQYPK